jgi:hypothetical protein
VWEELWAENVDMRDAFFVFEIVVVADLKAFVAVVVVDVHWKFVTTVLLE